MGIGFFHREVRGEASAVRMTQRHRLAYAWLTVLWGRTNAVLRFTIETGFIVDRVRNSLFESTTFDTNDVFVEVHQWKTIYDEASHFYISFFFFVFPFFLFFFNSFSIYTFANEIFASLKRRIISTLNNNYLTSKYKIDDKYRCNTSDFKKIHIQHEKACKLETYDFSFHNKYLSSHVYTSYCRKYKYGRPQYSQLFAPDQRGPTFVYFLVDQCNKSKKFLPAKVMLL